MKAKLARALAERRYVRLQTHDPAGAHYDGYVAHLGRDFVALRHAPNFQIDGWQVLSRRFLRGVRDGRLEATANEVLRMHGVDRRVKPPAWLLRCETFPEVIEAMGRRDIWPAIETLREGEDALYMGPLWSMDEQGVWIRAYSATGRWEKRYGLVWEDIVRVEWGSAYCGMFNAYMRTRAK
ncbi:MAG: hypothetical protein IT162_16535 [Bryobacterales bacterium]|nr:hypothetical protein [Bryobacterales bacterium]